MKENNTLNASSKLMLISNNSLRAEMRITFKNSAVLCVAFLCDLSG